MKRFILILFGFLFFSPLFGQTGNPVATCSSDTGITLDTQHSLADTYDIDFSSMNWTEIQANESAVYFDEKSDLITITVDFPNKKLEISLELTNPAALNWGVDEWNNHLASIR